MDTNLPWAMYSMATHRRKDIREPFRYNLLYSKNALGRFIFDGFALSKKICTNVRGCNSIKVNT